MIQNLLLEVGFDTLSENLKLIDKHVYLLISNFLVKSQVQQKLATNITIYNTVLLKKYHSFYQRQLTHYYEKDTHTTNPKTLLTLHIFRKPVSGWYQMKHLQCIIFRCLKH